MYLIFDLETTGLVRCPSFNIYPDFRQLEPYDSARIVQVAWVVISPDFLIIEKKSYVIKRDNFCIKNAEMHGIDEQRSDIEGVNFDIMAMDFMNALYKCDMIIAHNILFDFNVMANHLYRFDLYDIYLHFASKLRFCTSFESINVMKLKVNLTPDYTTYKYPSLQELYKHYYNKDFMNAHDALADSIACMECFIKLITDPVYLNSKNENAVCKEKAMRIINNINSLPNLPNLSYLPNLPYAHEPLSQINFMPEYMRSNNQPDYVFIINEHNKYEFFKRETRRKKSIQKAIIKSELREKAKAELEIQNKKREEIKNEAVKKLQTTVTQDGRRCFYTKDFKKKNEKNS